MQLGVEALAGAGIAAWGLWKLWPNIKGLVSTAAEVVDDAIDTGSSEPSTDSDFHAFQQLLDRARRLKSTKAQQCLRDALVPLFGGTDPTSAGGE